ncbi:lipopolysaccharide transport periplasmic protein LptA [Sulfuricurvum sp.]|uniref:lipopolysaccharide transport periplasmic protein LptA n=1 Tax=Sulfuricurvum sp. TaxID=2025608 RepID=UPI002E35A5F0|nr:lipopolysaccharide transport periplasmic protein LptA [Sulfuricurvum sp.]HEX5329926.1 lipopolysaccharide transport periplasmic protein LptA [Sulfuricurvum sp.]
MIQKLLILTFVLLSSIWAEELKVISDNFKGDQQKGISVFTGKVKVTKGLDELNASKVTIYTDKDKKPIKYLAEGDASFYIVTEMGEKYKGKSQIAIYLPDSSEYQFFQKVDLIRLDDYRRVKGDKVIVNTVVGNASAESANNDPVVMTFTLQDKKPKEKSPTK